MSALRDAQVIRERGRTPGTFELTTMHSIGRQQAPYFFVPKRDCLAPAQLGLPQTGDSVPAAMFRFHPPKGRSTPSSVRCGWKAETLGKHPRLRELRLAGLTCQVVSDIEADGPRAQDGTADPAV